MAETATETVDLKTACAVAIKALAPAAKAGVKAGLALSYEKEWLAEIARRREAEEKRREAEEKRAAKAERERAARLEARREAKRQRDRAYRARKRQKRIAARCLPFLEALYGMAEVTRGR